MNAQTNSTETFASRMPKEIAGGVVLIAIGALFLIAQFVKLDGLAVFIPAALGVIFLAGGVAARNNGLLIPGGILGGIGLGTYAIERAFPELGEPNRGGVFLLCFAMGWGLITLLSAIVTRRTMWWPLIPGAIMAAIGVAIMAGGVAFEALKAFGAYGWPLILIAVGVYVIFRRRSA